MKALITGVDGFVGGHLASYLIRQGGFEVFGTTFASTTQYDSLSKSGIRLEQIDLTDEASVVTLLKILSPDHIYHLAAQSFVPSSFENPWGTLRNNIQSQLNILHASAQMRLTARILVVGSAEEYGKVSPNETPIGEEQPLRPSTPYSVSKVGQDMLGLQYFLSHNVASIRVRPFNHTGPGQSAQFVVPAFANQIALIESGTQEPVIRVGNLDSQRDFSDVRDVVRAYMLLMLRGEPGEVYNVGSGTAHSIREVLDTLLSNSRAEIEVRNDPQLVRVGEAPLIVCNPSKLKRSTGWEPTIRFEQSLMDILNYWRDRHGPKAA